MAGTELPVEKSSSAKASWFLATALEAEFEPKIASSPPGFEGCWAEELRPRRSFGLLGGAFELVLPPRMSPSALGLPLKPGGGASFFSPPPSTFLGAAPVADVSLGMFAKFRDIFSPAFRLRSASMRSASGF